MKWINYFDAIYVINLSKREDRLLRITEHFEIYNIPFERVEAIQRANGAEGLRDTMTKIFREAIEKDFKRVLIFEDDAIVVVDEHTFHETMNGVTEQLPESFHVCFLGCQLSHRIKDWHSKNLFPVTMAFSTHSVAWGIEGMKQCVVEMGFPIDNWMTTNLEPLGKSYCVYPLLCSQVPGISDIGGGNYMDWRPFIDMRYEQKINEYKLGMR